MKTVALWLYQNEGGQEINERLRTLLVSYGVRIIDGFDLRKCYVKDGSIFTEDGRLLDHADIFYHMNADESNSYQEEMLQFLEYKGVRVMNSFGAYKLAKDKFASNLLLRQNGIRVPRSLLFSRDTKMSIVKSFFEECNNMVLLKPRSNHGGLGIMKFQDYESFADYLGMVHEHIFVHYLEEYIEFEEMDYRVEVVGGEAISGYRRRKKHSFKTNIGSGGSMVPELPDVHVCSVALRAARLLKLDCTIVDMVRSIRDQELYLLEVNPIMGIFLEAAMSSGYKISVPANIDPLFCTDNVKMNRLVQIILEALHR